MREVWAMQPRFEQRSGQRAYRLLETPRFRMSYDFLALRAASGEVPAELEAWWRAFQSADPESRRAMLLPDAGPRRKRRRRRRKRGAGEAPPLAPEWPGPTWAWGQISTIRRSRSRRRSMSW